MLAESTLRCGLQVPIRMQGGRSVGVRGSEAAPMFASEEREGKQTQMPRPAEAARQIAMPLATAEAGAPAAWMEEDAIARPAEDEVGQAEEMPETDWRRCGASAPKRPVQSPRWIRRPATRLQR